MKFSIGTEINSNDAMLEHELSNYANDELLCDMIKLANHNELVATNSTAQLGEAVDNVYSLSNYDLGKFELIVHGFTRGKDPFHVIVPCAARSGEYPLTFTGAITPVTDVPPLTVLTGLQLIDNEGRHLVRRRCFQGLYNGGTWTFNYAIMKINQ